MNRRSHIQTSNMTHNEETQKHLSAIEDAKNFFQAEIAKREAEIGALESGELEGEEGEDRIAGLNEEICRLTEIRIDLSNAEVSIGSAFELA